MPRTGVRVSMSDLWYRSCRGVEHGGHSLVLTETRCFWRVRHHLHCAESKCDLYIREPGFRYRRVRIGARVESSFPWLYLQLKYGILRHVLLLLGGIATTIIIYVVTCAIVRV